MSISIPGMKRFWKDLVLGDCVPNYTNYTHNGALCDISKQEAE